MYRVTETQFLLNLSLQSTTYELQGTLWQVHCMTIKWQVHRMTTKFKLWYIWNCVPNFNTCSSVTNRFRDSVDFQMNLPQTPNDLEHNEVNNTP